MQLASYNVATVLRASPLALACQVLILENSFASSSPESQPKLQVRSFRSTPEGRCMLPYLCGLPAAYCTLAIVRETKDPFCAICSVQALVSALWTR